MGFYGGLLGSNGNLASGKRLHSELENHHFESVNQLFLWAIFNSYVTNYQRVNIEKKRWKINQRPFFMGRSMINNLNTN